MNLNDVHPHRQASDTAVGGSTPGPRAARRPWTGRATRVTLMATVLAGAAAIAIATTVAIGTPSLAAEVPTSSASVALGYRPMWLPAGYVERGRSWTVGYPTESVQRTWSAQPIAGEFGGVDHQLRLSHSSPDELENPARVKLEVNDQPAAYRPPINGAGESSLVWRYDTDTVLELREVGTGLTQRSLVRIATSVRPDRAVATVPIRVPTNLRFDQVMITGDSLASWQARILVTSETASNRTAIVVGTEPEIAISGDQFTVRNHPAWLVTSYIGGDPETAKPTYSVIVDLRQDGGPAKYLTVGRFGASPEELVATAEGVEPEAHPDLAWLGR